MIAAAAAWLGKSALMSSPVGGLIKAIPRWAWLLLIAAIAVLVALRWHAGKVDQLRAESFAAGHAAAIAEGKQRIEVVNRGSAAIAADERKKADEEIDRNARRADALRVRGPGAAACLNPVVPGAAGGSGPVGGGADGPVDRVPGDERQQLIALPFAETVDRAEIADANRTEVLAWREWHRRQSEWWAKVSAAAEHEGGKK